jgi:hypothetical protein
MSAETPLVHRTVRTGGVFLAVGAAQFVAVLLWVQMRFPGFDPWTTTVTALGSSGSIWASVLDGSIIVLGVLAVLGLLFAWSAFDDRPSRGLGLFVLLVGAGATIASGAFLAAHARLPTYALWAAVYTTVTAGGVGLLIVSSAMHQHGRWRISRAYTFATGLVVLGAAVSAAARLPVGLQVAGLERVVVGAAVLWGLVEGLHLVLLHRYAPGLEVRVASA